MQTPDGKQGLVPVNYIDKLDIPPESVVVEKKVAVSPDSSSATVNSNNVDENSASPPLDEVI